MAPLPSSDGSAPSSVVVYSLEPFPKSSPHQCFHVGDYLDPLLRWFLCTIVATILHDYKLLIFLQKGCLLGNFYYLQPIYLFIPLMRLGGIMEEIETYVCSFTCMFSTIYTMPSSRVWVSCSFTKSHTTHTHTHTCVCVCVCSNLSMNLL